MSTTMIRVKPKVKHELDTIRNYEMESYSNVIQRLVNIAKEDDKLSEHEISQIEKSLEDIKKGRVLSMKEAEKKWGI